MKSTRWILLSACALPLLAAAQDLSAVGLAEAETPLHKKVAVDYREMNVAEVLKDLGEKSGVRFVIADGLLKGADKVTCAAKDQEAGRVAARILRPRGLKLGKPEGGQVAVERLDPFDELKVKRVEVFEFTEKPKVTREGDRVMIRFGVNEFCDATVAIEDSRGNILRHLASGVLGENAPEPFQWNSKKQELVWDGKNDQEVYVDDKDSVVVRVSLGLKPRFERTLYWSPKKRNLYWPPIIAAAPEGVFVMAKGCFDQLRQFDRDGNYVRTIYPFAAEKLKDMNGMQWGVFPHDGRRLPLKQGPQRSLFYGTMLVPPRGGGEEPDPDKPAKSPQTAAEHQLLEPQDLGLRPFTGLAIHNGQVAVIESQLIRLTTDGGAGKPGLWGPVTGAALKGFDHYTLYENEYGPASAAFSPDGKSVYLAGWTRGGSVPGNGVARLPYDDNRKLEPFAGTLSYKSDTRGKEPGQFNGALSVACDGQGRVYVADYLNDRIQVFSPEGKHLKSIATRRPAHVAVHKKTQDIYVFSWPVSNDQANEPGWPLRISHLGPFDRPDPVAGYVVKMKEHSSYMHSSTGPLFRVEIDSWAEPTTIWITQLISKEWDNANWQGLGTLMVFTEEKDSRKLATKRDFAKDAEEEVKRLWVYRPRMRMFVNPVSGELCLGEGDVATGKCFSSLLVIDPATGRIRIEKLPFAPEDMAFDLGGNAYLRTENLVVRYDSKTWREIPFDYGEARESVSFLGGGEGGGAKVLSGLPLPGFGTGCFHLGGMGVSPRGHVVVNCSNPMNPPKLVVGRVLPGMQGVEQRGGKPYTPQIYPGRARGVEIHVFDKHGKVLYEDSLRGIPRGPVGTFGVMMDRDDNLYALLDGERCYDGKLYLQNLGVSRGSCTLVKARPKAARILSAAYTDIPVGADKPDRPPDVGGAWIEGADWLYGGAGNVGKAEGGCTCLDTRAAIDLFARSFVPEMDRYSVAVLDSNGNVILRVGQYGNVDDGMPLIKDGGPPNPRSIGGDEVGLFNPAYLATNTDRRLFIGDNGNVRIASVKLGYHAEEKVALKDVKDMK